MSEQEERLIPVPPHTFGPGNPKARSAMEDQLLHDVEHAPNRAARREAERLLRSEQRMLDRTVGPAKEQ